VVDDEQDLIASVLFTMEPEEVLGYKPVVGVKLTIGLPLHPKEEVYEIISIAKEEYEGEEVWALRVKQPISLQ
jgi:hypothetical protein